MGPRRGDRGASRLWRMTCRNARNPARAAVVPRQVRRYAASGGPVIASFLDRRQLDVAELDRRALGLQQDLAPADLSVGALVREVAVDHQLDRVALAGNLVPVPLPGFLLDRPVLVDA